jgi:hypothetical protein
MSKIKIKQIDTDTVCISISKDTPISMVNELAKSLIAKGMVEDLSKSTISNRYFYRHIDADDVAEQLIKSLQSMTKADEYTKSQWEAQARNRLAQRNIRRQGLGLGPITADQMKNPTGKTPPQSKPAAPNQTGAPSQTGATTLPGIPNKLVDIRSNFKKDDKDLSNQPKKKSSFELKGKASDKLTARLQSKANNRQYVTQSAPKEIEPAYGKQPMKKSWGQHLPFPSAEEEIMKFAEAEKLNGETAAANQLVKLMAGKSMLGVQPPPQPTDEEMFGSGVVTEEMAKAAQHKWNNTFNNWMVEASKPITQKFASEEEELAYWNSIKVNDRDDGSSGY